MKHELDQRHETEREIARLKRKLSSSASPIGDWKGIKYREYIDAGLPAPYSEKEMKNYYAQRVAVRERINELQAQLET